jgi:putative ABC transport system permease protein
MHTAQIATDVVTDSVFALRSFRRAPGWTFVTLMTIALGVGASTAVLSVADTFLIRPLPYRDASRVYTVSLQGRLPGETISLPISADVVREWRNSARAIEAAASYGGSPAAYLHGDLDDVRVTTATVDTGFLAFTGARPLIGRNFTAEETTPNGPHAIMLAEGFWRRQFGASPNVLGKVVRVGLGGEPGSRATTIVGVMPASLFVPDFKFERPDVWLPLIDGKRGSISGVAVRLPPGLSPKAASQELTAIFDRAGGIDPDDRPLQPRIRLSRPQDDLPFRQALILLTGAVMFLLLIACSNVSHLLLQRGVGRERELAVRHAIGAHRARLVRQLVTESAMLGLAGGALAVLVGWSALKVLAQLRPTSLPALSHLPTTRGVIPIAAGLAIAVGLAVGVLAALHVSHKHLGQSLRAGASSAPVTHRRLRGTLVVGQIALSAILLAGAILLIRAVVELERVRLGFDPHDLYAVEFRDRDLNAFQSPESRAAFARMIRDLAERQVGSQNLTIAASAMADGTVFASAFETREHPGAVGPLGFTGVDYVAPDYFSTLRMPLIAGRTFDEGSFSRADVIVSRSLAQHLGYDANVVGRQFRNSRREGALQQWQTVVGVAPDIVTNRLYAAKPTLYLPFPGNAFATSLIVRLPRKDAEDVVRRFAKSVQPDPLTWRVTDVDAKIEQSIAEPRFTMAVLVLFAVSGVLLAAMGMFGAMSYSLGMRTREIGVRITLGATRRNITGLFVRDALGQAALGTGIGLAGTLGVARLIRMSFYGVESFDTITFILAAASILLASLAACAGPLFRATRVDPVVALRAE